MTSKNKELFLGRMSSICADQSSLTAKIAMISLFGDSPTSTLFHKILLLLEYLQLLSPILLFTLFFHQTQDSFSPRTLLFVARLINPGLWLSFDDLNSAEILILVGLFIFTLLKYVLLGWIIYQFLHNSQPQNLVTKLWRNLFEVQGRVLYFCMTFFWVNMAMTTSVTENLNEETESRRKLVISLVAISLDFAFSLILYSRYHYMLPLKNFLSSKDNTVEMITLVQKLVVQILTIFLPLDTRSSTWVVTVINVIIDLFRNFYFFRRLPLYSFQALNFQAIILMAISSANIASLACVIGKSVEGNTVTLPLFVYIWVVLFILTVRISREYLKTMFWEIICNPSLKNPALLLHRITAIKELEGLAEEDFGSNDNYLWGSLVNRSLNTNLKSLLKLKENMEELDINDKKSAKVIYKSYLERLLEKYPNNSFVQLYATQFFMKKFQKYGDGVKTAQHLKAHGSINVKLNAELLLIQIQNQLREKAAERNRQSQIDPTSYLQEQSLFFKLQTSMLEQAKAQIKVCQEMKRECPDTNVIHESSQTFNQFRKKNLKRIKNLLESLSETNLEPLLLYAHYSLSLNHCYEDYSLYLKIYSQRLQRYQKYFDEEDLCKKNIFQNNTGLYLLSGNKANAGHIMFAPKALGTRTGARFDTLNDATIMSRIAPCLRTIHALFYKNAAEHNDETYFNKATRGYIFHQDGYLMEVTYHLNIHPYVTQGFYFVLFLRPIISSRDTIYLLENGDIDCGTKTIAERLGLLNITAKNGKNIKNISEDLAIANQAFNMIAFPQKYPPTEDLTMEEAQEIYNEYSTPGKNILLSPLEQDENGLELVQYSYRCKIINRTFGPRVIKALILEENIKENLQNLNLRTYERLRTKRQKTVTTVRRFKIPTEKDFKIPTEKDFESQPFEADDSDKDEKEEGWINFEAMASRKIQPNHLFKSEEDGDTCTEAHREDFSSRMTSPTAAPLMESERKPIFAFDSPRVIRSATRKKTFYMVRERDTKETERHSHKASSLNESHSKGVSQRKRLEHAFKVALEYKHYPGIFKWLACLVYTVLFAFMLSQFLIVQIFYNNLDNFQAQKDILRAFQLRNFYLISAQGLGRLIYDVQSGSLNTSGLRTFARGLDVYRSIATKYLTNLTETNQDILLNAKLFDTKISNLLFAREIPIYYTYFDQSPQIYEDQTSFIAVDQITIAALDLVKYNGTDSDGIVETANFVFRNSLNDLLVKNQEISDKIVGFLNEQRENIHQYIIHAFVIELVIVFVVLMFFIFALWRQHKKEVFNLSSFCRVYGQKVEVTLKGFVEFKEMIEDQKPLSNELTKLSQKENTSRIIEEPVKREAFKRLNHRGLRRKYYVYIGIFLVLLVILGLFMIVSAVQTFNLLNDFKDEQEQIYFVDYTRTRLQLCIDAARELLATNNTVYVENRLALNELSYLLDELKVVKSQIYDKLLNENTLEKIPSVKAMLLDDPCGYIALPETGFYCSILDFLGVEKGLVYLLGDFEEFLIDILNQYETSDKSHTANMNILKSLYNTLPPFIFVLASGALSMANIIDGQLEKQLQSSKDNRSLFLVGCFTIIIGTGCLTWIFILRKLKESISQFKNTLKVFPADIILSSFILKNFLSKTSKGSTFSAFKKE